MMPLTEHTTNPRMRKRIHEYPQSTNPRNGVGDKVRFGSANHRGPALAALDPAALAECPADMPFGAKRVPRDTGVISTLRGE